MALARRSQRFNTAIWPGFVDAMTGLLLVLMFVLTIFMVIQFVLQETISGQEDKLDELSVELSALASTLGLERARANQLAETVDVAAEEMNAQSALITQLTLTRDAQAAELAQAQSTITGFEAQVAGLLAERDTATATIADLEANRDTLVSEQEALNLALASARDEIDAGTEAARLAAARREALEALVADLEAKGEASQAEISDLEAARIADAAAAEALRDRLANADAELTAMTLALEEKRKEAEDTLTLLAATQAARDELGTNLAAALLAQQQAEANLSQTQENNADIDARLAAALMLQQSTQDALDEARDAISAANVSREDLQAQLAAALLAQDASGADMAALEAQLAEALLAQEALESNLQGLEASNDDAATRTAALLEENARLQAQVETLSLSSTDADQARLDLQARLAAALRAQEGSITEAEQQAALLAAANEALSQEEALSAESQRKVALLNEQVAALRNQVGTLQSLLEVANDVDADSQVQIDQLGQQLNTALARVAAEERRRAALEEAERLRLEAETARLSAEAQNLERFRSDFFGQIRDILEGQDGVRIEGDRFVFSSEVLFRPGQAELSDLGRNEIAKVASILRDIADRIPAGIDWVIRVDGHTDNVPLSGNGLYADNWELSQARALSVVRYMSGSQGIAPSRLAANGFGEYQPINLEDSDAARAQNRRIELKLTEK